MHIGRIKGATRDLGKPADWNEEEHGPCGSLPVRDEIISGNHVMVSEWIPTEDELTQLMAGASINLYVYGTIHPPVAIGVDASENVDNRGTLKHRFEFLMHELEKRFPENTEHRKWCAEPPELDLLREIDRTLGKNNQI